MHHFGRIGVQRRRHGVAEVADVEVGGEQAFALQRLERESRLGAQRCAALDRRDPRERLDHADRRVLPMRDRGVAGPAGRREAQPQRRLLARRDAEDQPPLLRQADEIQRLAENLEVRNRFIRNTFGRYLSDEVVAHIVDSKDEKAN